MVKKFIEMTVRGRKYKVREEDIRIITFYAVREIPVLPSFPNQEEFD